MISEARCDRDHRDTRYRAARNIAGTRAEAAGAMKETVAKRGRPTEGAAKRRISPLSLSPPYCWRHRVQLNEKKVTLAAQSARFARNQHTQKGEADPLSQQFMDMPFCKVSYLPPSHLHTPEGT